MPEHNEVTRRWAVRVVVYVMLVASSGAAFLLNEWLWRSAREGRLPFWAPLLPVATFTAFVVVYVIDRWLLVRRRHFPPLRAFFQVAIAVAFLALLWPRQASELRRSRVQIPEAAAGPEAGPSRLLAYSDPEVRAAACELAGYRGEKQLLQTLEGLATSDASALVRAACRAAANRLQEPEAQP